MDFDTLTPVLALAACGWLIWRQLTPWLRAHSMTGRPAPSAADLPDPRLYYFWSPQCGLCREMSRRVDRLRESHPDLIKVNILERMEFARDLGVAATPSLVLVRSGRIEKILLGTQTDRRMLELLGQDDDL